jgi:hypothetical protein
MIAACPLLALAALVFVDQDIPGIDLGSADPLSGAVAINGRHADLDRDGLNDLILPREILFQRNGAFPPEARIPLPGRDEHGRCDVWGDTLYLRFDDRLELLQWDNGAWRRVLVQPMAWPSDGTQAPADHSAYEDSRGVRFERFLHDMDSDQQPEIVLPGEEGLHIYRRGESGYSEVKRLDVFPPPALARVPRQALWPAEVRRLMLPAREMTCRFSIEGTALTVVAQRDLPGMRSQYRVKRYTLDPRNQFTPVPGETREEDTVVSNDLRPCRLNNDAVIDYAGGDWTWSEASVLPIPIFATRVSLDGGKTVRTVRTPSFRPPCSFEDFDGDGNLDMVTYATGLFDGGVRESVDRFLSAREVRHEIDVYLQDAQKRFASSPDVQARFTVTLDAPPFRNTPFFQRYLAGEIFDVTGDINGDGRRDIVAQDRPARLAVYFNDGGSFAGRPDAVLNVQEDCQFSVADVDGDGRSDIVVYGYGFEKSAARRSRVYFAREGAP